MYRTLLVDDEQLARRRLRRLLTPYATTFDVVGEAHDGQSAVAQAETLRPELLFLDIQMPVRNGFEVLAALSYRPVVIFTTAHDAHALQAFATYAIDYLLKPIEPDRLAQTVEKLTRFGADPFSQRVADLLAQVVPQAAPLTALPVRRGDRIRLVNLDEISHLLADDKYVTLCTADGQRHLLDQSLTSLEARLPPTFIRISRSAIVHRAYIGELEKHFNGRYVLHLRDQPRTALTSGSTYADRLRPLWSL